VLISPHPRGYWPGVFLGKESEKEAEKNVIEKNKRKDKTEVK
jgi:hypothetical protein